MTFWAEALPYAQQAYKYTGVHVSVVLAQWADETAYGGPDWSVYHNPGNVGDPGSAGQTSYPTIQAGVNAYISTMNLGYYIAVREAAGWQAQCYALGRSPWAGGHYETDGPPPGQDLVKIIIENDLTQYDVPPPVPAAPQPPPIPATTISPRGAWVLYTIAINTDVNGNGWTTTSIPWANFCAISIEGSDPAPTADDTYFPGCPHVQEREGLVLISITGFLANSQANVFVLATQ